MLKANGKYIHKQKSPSSLLQVNISIDNQIFGKVTIHGLGSLGSGLLGSGLPGLWALGSLGSGLWARRPGLQSLLGSRDYWAPWAPKQESALSL